LTDNRVEILAKILVDHSTQIKPGDRVAIEATTAAAPLVNALYTTILDRGGFPYPLLELPEQELLLFTHAGVEQLEVPPPFRVLAYEQFESRIRIHSAMNPRALSGVDLARQRARQQGQHGILDTQMRRGADRSFKWVSTLYPTEGYASEAGMDYEAFADFVFSACHANQEDPLGFWRQVEVDQRRIVERLQGHDKVTLRGRDVDLKLSIKGRQFVNAAGLNNMPDGEVFTGPVEDSVSGWVRFTYPAITNGVMVEGIELTFTDGKVTHATARENQDFLREMVALDAGSQYVGEFAIGTNYDINRFSHNILFDEKIGGTFHMALGSGYPETGSRNRSMLHWDMICGIRESAEMLLDGELVYRDGNFVF
jgi:aminopeptidase